MKKIERDFDGEGKTRTFAYLWVTTKRMFELVEDEKEYQIRTMTMSCMLYCAFTLEAFLNHIGNLIPDQWSEKHGRKRPKEKLELIEKHPEKPWNWYRISMNPNITMDIIEKYLDKPWNWRNISINKNITMEIIEKYH